ncbi:hypothetical protein [Bradyrhizobium sp.]|uniref:hypothetical protein n=1 Tax=Bradyrhizobium sp. TaxID=376 RepID=UPI0039E43409
MQIVHSSKVEETGPPRSLSLRLIAAYVAGLIACWLLLGFGSIKPFSLLSLSNDSFYTLNFAKNYVNGAGFRVNPYLAFPEIQDNAYFPSFDFSYRAFMRMVAWFSDGPAPVYYLLYVAGVAAMFATSAFALRSLRFNHWLSIFGAIVYVVSPWLVIRAFSHDFLALYYSAPLGVALALRVGLYPEILAWRLSGAALSLLVVATSGVYYAFFSLMFIAFLGAVGGISRQQWQPAVSICVVTAGVLVLLMVTGYGSALPDILTGAIPPTKRIAGAQLVFGLNFSEATHLFDDIPRMAWVRQEYVAFWPYLKYPHNMPDWPGLTLTLVMLASPVILPILANTTGPRSYQSQLILLATASIAFGIIYAMEGGLAYYFGLFINPSIRATDRIIPFLAFFALVVLLATVDILLARRLLSKIGAGLVLAALLVSMLPSVNGLARYHRAIMDGPAMVENIASIRQLLAAKDRENLTAVLQLPHAAWPETAPQRSYDMLSLQAYFVLDRKGSTTRWSYGSRLDQASYQIIEKMLRDNQPHGLAGAAAAMGFNGAVIDKAPLSEDEWRAFAANLDETSCKIFEDSRRLLYSFRRC